jgi:hypothetical protein
VDAEHWGPLLDHLCSVVVTSAPNRLYLQYASQLVTLPDPLSLSRRLVINVPTVDVHVLAVKTNRQTYALDLEEQRGPLEPPQLKLYGADAQCQSLARALFPESR